MVCLASSTPIDDGVREPMSLTDLGSTLAWNQDVTITIGLNGLTRVTARQCIVAMLTVSCLGLAIMSQVAILYGTLMVFTHCKKMNGCFNSVWLPQFHASVLCITEYEGVPLAALHSKQ